MASSNTVNNNVRFNIDSRGIVVAENTARDLARAVDGLGAAINRQGRAMDGSTRSTDTWNKTAKGAAGIAGSQTKAFSKMAQGMTGSLVPAYATLAANIFAVSAAFRVLKDAADFSRLQEASLEYSKSIGVNLQAIAKGITTVTNESVTMQKSLQMAAIASAAGFDAKTIQDLAQAARNASVALGRDMTDSLDRVFSGALKAEPELLDELGIILRLKPATDAYAKQLGVAVGSLTTFQKQQAVVNEVIRQTDEKFGHLGKVMNEGNIYAMLYVKAANALKISLSGLNVVLTPVLKALSGFDHVLTGIALITLPKVFGLFKEQAINIFTSFEKGAIDSANAVSKTTASLQQQIQVLERLKKAKIEAARVEAVMDSASRSGDPTAMREAAVFAEDMGSENALNKAKKAAKGYNSVLIKTKLYMTQVQLAGLRLKASLSIVSSAFIHAATSTESFKDQVKNLSTKLRTVWGAKIASFPGLIGKIAPAANAATDAFSSLVVGVGEVVGTFVRLIPWIGAATVAFDLLTTAYTELTSPKGFDGRLLNNILQSAASNADIAREALDRLHDVNIIKAEKATNIINTLGTDIARLQRNIKGATGFEHIIGDFKESDADKALVILNDTAKGFITLMDKMGDSAPEKYRKGLERIIQETEALQGSTLATTGKLKSLAGEVLQVRDAFAEGAGAMRDLEEISFEELEGAMKELIIDGKDSGQILMAVKEAMTDMEGGAITSSAAVMGLASAFKSITDSKAIFGIKQMQQDIALTAEEYKIQIKELQDARDEATGRNNKIKRSNIDKAILDLTARKEAAENRIAELIKSSGAEATKNADELITKAEEVLAVQGKIADLSNSAGLLNVHDSKSLTTSIELQKERVSLIQEQINLVQQLAGEEELTGESKARILALQKSQVELLKGTVSEAKKLYEAGTISIGVYSRVKQGPLTQIKQILQESANLSETNLNNILASIAATKGPKQASNKGADLSFYDQEIARLIERNIEITAGERALYAYGLQQQLNANKITETEKKALLATFDANKAAEQKIKDQKAYGAAQVAAFKKSEKAMAAIDRRLKSTAATSLDVFSGPAKSLWDMVTALDALSKSLGTNASDVAANQGAWAKFNDDNKNFEGPLQKTEEFYKRDKELTENSTALKIQGATLVGNTIVSMLNAQADAAEEGSKKQKALQAASLAMQAVMAISLGALAIIQALASNPGPSGVAMAVVTAAIVAAQLATIGIQAAGISGGGSSSVPELQTTQGTGTVLGDATAVSESLSNGMDILEEYASIGNEHTSKMLVALISIDRTLKETSIGISRSKTFSDFSNNPYGVGSLVEGDGSLFGNSKKPEASGQNFFASSGQNFNVKDAGIKFDELTTFGDAFTTGITVQYFAIVDEWKKVMWLFKKNSRTNHYEGEVESQVNAWFTDIISGIYSAAVEGFQVLMPELSTEQIEKKVGAVQLDIGKISLLGLDSEGINEALAGVFSASADKLIEAVLPSLGAFQQAGEGLFETFTRVVAETENANTALVQFGIEAINYKDVILKQGEIGSQIVKQSLLAVEKYAVIRDILATSTGSVDEIITLKQDLDEVQDLIIKLGGGFDLLSVGMINAAGGLDNLSSSLSSYYENFYSEQERFNADFNSLNTAFKDMGLTMPYTKKGFRELVELLVAAGDKQTATRLIAINQQFSDTVDSYEKLQKSQTDGMLEWNTALLEANRSNDSLLETAIKMHLAAEKALAAYDGSTDSMDALQEAIDSRYAAELALIKGIEDAINSIDTTVSTAIENITVGNLDDEGKYNYHSAIANRTAEEIRQGKYTSPEEISKAVSTAISAASTAYGLLDEAGKKQNEAGYISFIQGLEIDSKALLNAQADAVKDSTASLATSVVDVVGLENIRYDIGSIAELMGKVADNTNYANILMQSIINNMGGANTAGIVDSSVRMALHSSSDPSTIANNASSSIIDSLVARYPELARFDNQNSQDQISSAMLYAYNDSVQAGNSIEQAIQDSINYANSLINNFIQPFLQIPEPTAGNQVQQDLIEAERLRNVEFVEGLNQVSADQIEASNTMLDAAAIIREAAKTMQEVSEYLPAQSYSSGAVNA